MAGRFEDKVALVTGAASGIGRGSAQAFAHEGAKVVVADVTEDGGRETVKLIEDAGGQATFVKTDVSKAADVEALVNEAISTYGRLDYAHNNAGVLGKARPVHETDEADWDRLISINLKGVWLCMKYEVPQMLKQGGAIVNTSSAAGIVGMEALGAYTASKHGVAGLTKSAALDYAKLGIRVNAVCPGGVDTPLVRNIEDPKSFPPQAMPVMPRFGKPEDIANAVIWLCSDESSYVTGHLLVVDGAMTVP
jgi:NAD(P)-dependent dehydrogenase (short-subunit alcohol dehydrogenase family)